MPTVGFTRFEAPTPDIHGEYEGDVQVAAIDPEPRDFPAVENRGEGIFLQLKSKAVNDWAKSNPVVARGLALSKGHQRWSEDRVGRDSQNWAEIRRASDQSCQR